MTMPRLAPTIIPFDSIAGISPHNPRRERSDAAVEIMIASIIDKGLLDDLILHEDAEAAGRFLVLKGGTRWLALCGLVARHRFALDNGCLQVLVASGNAQQLRDLALTLDVVRSNLHPVDEYEAFCRLDLTPSEIAVAYGITLRQAQQRLKLGELAPEIRASWRNGRIDGKQAEAFAAAGDAAAQIRLLEELAAPGKPVTKTPAEIRKLATKDSMPADCAEALFVGAEAYREAGGVIDEDLFADEVRFRDGTLLRALSVAKLAEHAKAIAEHESWGHIFAAGERFRIGGFDIDQTKAEIKDLEKIERALETAQDRVEIAALMAKQDEHWSKIYRRSLSVAQRKKLGICISLDPEGFPSIERGLERIPEAAPASAPHSEERPKARAAKDTPKAPAPVEPEPKDEEPKALLAVINRAIQPALTQIVRTRVDIAMTIVTTYLWAWDDEVFTDGLLSDLPLASPRDHYLYDVPSEPADTAFYLGRAPVMTLDGVFAEAVASRISVHRGAPEDLEAVIRAVQARGGDLAPAIAGHFDYEAYFKAATKEAAVQAINACDGDDAAQEAGKLTKKKAQIRAAESARAKRWLPAPLRDWLTTPAAVDESEWRCVAAPEEPAEEKDAA